ncbi:hypothetical protein [Nonomuraea roseola]|uniref:Uncharacterized protein n=1 Tax=Nonomuraea roseola TaxID=46179 RepID=A0ABV5PQG8_9ACTN
MAVLDVHFKALDDCADAAADAAKRLVPADMLLGKTPAPPKDVESSIFGRLDHSHDLASDVQKIWRDILGTDLQDGRERLRGVERALDKVQSNIREADRP